VRITVIGTGYAGLVTAAGLAEFGHQVVGLDADPAKVDLLRAGTVPLFEPGLDDLVRHSAEAGRLRFTTDYAEAIPRSEAVFITVSTPSLADGEVDLRFVAACVASMASHLSPGTVVVVKSTVPVGTTRRVAGWLADDGATVPFEVASNPEFLRQGAAIEDFLHPDRLVIGTGSEAAETALREIYRPLLGAGVEEVFTSLEGAELIKYASNSFLAVKLSFINEIADLCEASGASVDDVARGIGLDPRIGPGFLGAGPGFGGSCLPKDTLGLLHTSRAYGTASEVVAAAVSVNDRRKDRMLGKIADAVGGSLDGAKVALLGLTYKAHTDDLRSSPAIDIARGLAAAGAFVKAYDPRGMEPAKEVLDGVAFAADAYDAMTGCDVVVIATEWPEFAGLDLDEAKSRLARPVIVDLRNLYDPEDMARAGFEYSSIGR
jgi:UDPglucose 6-dehydrogenase